MSTKQLAKRRSFLRNSLLGGVGILLSGTPLKAKGSTNLSLDLSVEHIYATESGTLGKDRLFGLGLMKIGDVDELDKEIRKLRKRHNYRTQLSYGSNDHYKVPFAKAVIDLIFERNDIVFHSMVFDGVVANENKKTNQGASSFYVLETKQDYYQKLIKKASVGRGKTISVKYQSPSGPSILYAQQFLDKTNCTYKAKDNRQSNGLQISSLLTGSVLAAYDKRKIHPVKTEIINYLQGKLGGQTIKPGVKNSNSFIFHKEAGNK